MKTMHEFQMVSDNISTYIIRQMSNIKNPNIYFHRYKKNMSMFSILLDNSLFWKKIMYSKRECRSFSIHMGLQMLDIRFYFVKWYTMLMIIKSLINFFLFLIIFQWNSGFILAKKDEQIAYTFFAKTDDMRIKWIEAIKLSL